MAVNRNFTKNFNLSGGELYYKLNGEANFSYFGATNEFKINFKSTKVEHKSSETATLVTDMEVTKEVEASLSFTTEDLNKNALAMAFSGNSTDKTQTAGSETDVLYEAVESKKLYDLAVDGVHKLKVSNVVVKYDDDNDADTDDVEAVLDVDYSVNEEFGTIEIADNGVLDGKDIKVSFDYAEVALVDFTSLDETSREFTLMFLSKNATGNSKKTIVHRVKLSLNGDYSLKDLEKFTSLSFDGKVLLDSSQPEGKQFVETTMIES